MVSRILLFALLSATALAHFHIVWPTGRGFDEDKIVDFPCGGFDTVNKGRTMVPLSNFPIQLSMEHTEVKGEVLLALGNDPGVNYSIVLKPAFQENGPDNFCIGGVTIPSNLGIKAGDNATIQVVTNGDPNGGLYQCADVTFTDTPLSTADYNTNCKNSTGVTASFNGGGLPNGTSTGTSSSTSSGGTSSTASAGTATSSAGAAQMTMAAWAVGAMGLAGGLAAL